MTGVFHPIRGKESRMMRTSLRIASQLLAVERRKGSHQLRRITISPAIVAVLNLFFCGYYDRFLRNDVDGYYLTLLFFIEASLCFLFTVGFLIQRVEEVVVKTTIFPTTSLIRMLFTIMCTLSRPLLIAQVITANIFLIVFYRHDGALVVYAPIIFLLMMMNIVIITAIVFLKTRESIHRITVVALGILLFMIGAPIGVVVFHLTSLLSGVPIISWATAGILAIHNAQYGSASIYITLHIIVFVVALIVGRKVV
jgi:hypothetical protein